MSNEKFVATVAVIGFGFASFYLGYRMGTHRMFEVYGEVASAESLAYLAAKDTMGDNE